MPETLIRTRPVSTKNTELPVPSRQLPSKRKSGLTPKQDKAIALLFSGLNMYQAALQAGYSESMANVAGKEVFYKPEVQAEIRRIMAESVSLDDFNPDTVIRMLLMRMQFNIADHGNVTEDGDFHFDFRHLSRIQMAAISGITIGSNGRAQPQFFDPLKIAETLAKILKMFDKDLRGSSEDGGPVTLQTLDAIRQKIVNNNTVINNITVNNPPTEHKQLEGQVVDAE